MRLTTREGRHHSAKNGRNVGWAMKNSDSRVESLDVVIVGGGIHGVGLLHDLASRGLTRCLLLEKGKLGSATSSRSTKLIHGGLRYLSNISDFSLVHSALQERKLLTELLPDLVKPIELIFPILKNEGIPGWKVGAGLTIYDLLAGKKNLFQHRRVEPEYVLARASILQTGAFSKFYSFWDAQTDDQALVLRVAESAKERGAQALEGAEVTSLTPSNGRWLVQAFRGGELLSFDCRYVALCTGPWSGRLLEKFKIASCYEGLNNKGVHLLVKDLGLKCGLFLQSPEDNRIFFVLPWMGRTLIGTTETEFDGDPSQQDITKDEVKYLLNLVNRYLSNPLSERDIESVFSGLRWLPNISKNARNISKISREAILEELSLDGSAALTVFGGKLTTYRRLCKEMGDLISKKLGENDKVSNTHLKSFWTDRIPEIPDLRERFGKYGN